MKVFAGLLLVTLCFFSISGCGKEGTSAASGATITISPSDFTWNNPRSTVEWKTHFFTITVKDSSGNPANKIKINIYYPIAEPYYPYVQLYDGSTPMGSPFDAYTDSYGVYNLRFDYQSGGGLDYYGDLEVRSGSAFQKIRITITPNE